MIKVIYSENKEELFEKARIEVNASFQFYINLPLLFLVSTGSAFSLLSLINDRYLTPNLTIGVLDERYSFNETINNYAQLKKDSFYFNAKKNGCLFIDTTVKKNEKIEKFADRIDKAFHEWTTNNASGVIIATQGIGLDGHTAGIFPYHLSSKNHTKRLNDPNKWVFGYDVENKNKYNLRITPNFYFLKNIVKKTFVYVAGNDKQTAITRTLAQKGLLSHAPARILRYMNNVTLFTDIKLNKHV